MNFIIFRDLPSIAFVRCLAPIEGSRLHAEGTGFLVSRAIAKCRSEAIEGEFQLSHPDRNRMLGIAAHPLAAQAQENAYNEALESLVLKQVALSGVFHGVSVEIGGITFCLGRATDRFIAFFTFTHLGVRTATQAVSKNPFVALLRAWSEIRNLRLYRPHPSSLPYYTRANRFVGADRLSAIRTSASLKNNLPQIPELKFHQQTFKGHFVSYFL